MGFLTCKYRKNKDGEIESEMFDSDNIPDGYASNSSGNGIKLGTTTGNHTQIFSEDGHLLAS